MIGGFPRQPYKIHAMIRCIAVDDEPLALKQMENYISKIPYFKLVGTCSCTSEALKLIQEDIVDAMFLDINMPDHDGIEFIKSLPTPPVFVFTTAYDNYAIAGFKFNAADYLLKPFSFEDFLKAAEKVRLQYEQRSGTVAVTDVDDVLFFKTEYKIVRVEISTISCIEGMSEYLKIHLTDGNDPLVILLSMKKIEVRLPAYFMRVHKSYIINLRKIREVSRGRILLEDGMMVPIGDIYRDTFNSYLESKFIGK